MNQVQIFLTLDETEHRDLARQALAAGQTLNEWIRSRAGITQRKTRRGASIGVARIIEEILADGMARNVAEIQADFERLLNRPVSRSAVGYALAKDRATTKIFLRLNRPRNPSKPTTRSERVYTLRSQ